MLSLAGCSKVIYSNEQFMDGLKTKENIVNKLGLPNEKRMAGDVEEWLYKYEDGDRWTKTPVAHIPVTSTDDVSNLTPYKRFVLFKIDTQGNVLSWTCEGVSFTKRKPAPVTTIALVVTSVGLFCLLLWATYNPLPSHL